MSDEPKVVPLGAPNHAINLMLEEVLEVVRSYEGRVTLAEVVGTLEIAKLQVIQEQQT